MVAGLAAASTLKIMVFAASQALYMLVSVDALSEDTDDCVCSSCMLSRGTPISHYSIVLQETASTAFGTC